METNRLVADCRKYPSEKNCSLLIAGTEDEVLAVALEHAVTAHGHARTEKLREELRNFLEKESEANPDVEHRNHELAVGMYEAFNRRDFDHIERLADANATMTNVATEEVFRGPKGLRSYVEGWAKAFPDAKVEIDRVTASPEGVAVEFIGSGTHKGVLSSPAGALQPTGRKLRLRFAEVIRLRDGKIIEGRAYFNLASLLTQLGITPGAPPPTAQAQAPAAQRH